MGMIVACNASHKSGHNLIKKVWSYATKFGLTAKVNDFKVATGKSSGLELGVALWKCISKEMREQWHAKSASQEQCHELNESACDELLEVALDFAKENEYVVQAK